MGELTAALTIEEEEVDLLVHCVSGGTMDIFVERKDTDTTFWKLFSFDRFFQFINLSSNSSLQLTIHTHTHTPTHKEEITEKYKTGQQTPS